MQQIKRSELYQLVCSKPLSKLAPQFGTDGTKLAAICRENNVPYPGSGYWVRLALGKDTDLPLLLPTGDGQDPLITILPHQPKQRRERADSFDITGEGAEGLFKRIAAIKAERSW